MKQKLITFITLIVLWQGVFLILGPQNYILPSPKNTALTFIKVFESGEIIKHIFVSLKRVVIGFTLASVTGVFLGLILGYFKKAGSYFHPIVEILRPIPPIAWIPIAILIFGLGNGSAYFIVFLGAFFPIFTNTFFGVKSLPRVYKNVALSFEVTKFIFFKKILFYFSLPYIFTGLRIGIGMAWMSVIAAELIGAQSGLGYFIQLNRLLLQTEKIIIGMILIGMLGYFLNKIISILEKRLIPWKI
ncbi:ABC transporter permease [Candidatus Falkowbacteria bacterium]|nr:ABC transporter permease [Candidatus Falkowbacteria bacterium]